MHIVNYFYVNKSYIISTDEDPGLRMESFAVINLRGVSTNKTIYTVGYSTCIYPMLKHSMN
jgi:hypothetical protein